MAKVTVEAGSCGFRTEILAESQDGNTVALRFESDCPHVIKGREALATVETYSELFRKPHETRVYLALSPHLPHTACPLYAGFLKAIEVAAGLALPRDAVLRIER